MRKFLLVLFLQSIMGLAMKGEPKSTSGIIVTYQGAEVSYKLAETPTVIYTVKDGIKLAQLFLKNEAEPVVSIKLDNNVQLTIVYGEYKPTSIEVAEMNKASIVERNGRKYIIGGKLVIIDQHGKKYNTSGQEIQ